jgi:hypothetical protein
MGSIECLGLQKIEKAKALKDGSIDDQAHRVFKTCVFSNHHRVVAGSTEA